MIINTEIVDNYIKYNNLECSKNHWIYSAIVPGSIKLEEPKNIHMKDIVNLKKQILYLLENFKPINYALWQQVFANDDIVSDKQEILVVVGLPEPYDALVRTNLKGDNVIVFDVVRLLGYNKLDRVIPGIVTHEVAHILIDKKYRLYTDGIDLFTKLKQLLFDEGFAHYLSFENIVDFDDEDKDSLNFKMNAFTKLNEIVNGKISEEILEEGISGPFWDKYIAISGFFTVIEYMKEYGNISELYNKGYEYFWTYWNELVASKYKISKS